MIKLVAFDLDGTVADTLSDLAAATNHALAENGFKTYPVADYRFFVGNGVDNLIAAVLAENCTEETHRAVKRGFQEYYQSHSCDLTAAYNGMSGVLDALAERGVKTAVISNKPDAFVPRILAKLYPGHRFALGWGQRENIPRKPAPDALLEAMRLLKVSGEEAVYVGDSDVDVYFAHAAGLKVIGVEWGFRGREELLSAGADSLAATPADLLTILERF